MRLLLVQKRFCKIELKEEKKKQNHEQSDGICVFFHWDEFSFSTTTIIYLTNFLRCFSIYIVSPPPFFCLILVVWEREKKKSQDITQLQVVNRHITEQRKA
jgi:hypothetical protein